MMCSTSDAGADARRVLLYVMSGAGGSEGRKPAKRVRGRDRRRIPDDVDLPCPDCEYNLRGLVREEGFRGMETGAKCPECGRESDLWSMYCARYRRRIFLEGLLLQLLALFGLMLPVILYMPLRVTNVFSIIESTAAFWLGAGVCLVHAFVATRIIGERLDFGEKGLFIATAIGVLAANLTLMIVAS